MDITISVLDLLSQPVSKMPGISCISADDDYIVERITDGLHENFKLSYSSLSTRVLDDISTRLGLSSMAYKDVWEYSLRSHEHEYSFVECYPQYTSSDITSQYESDEKVPTSPHDLPEWIGTIAICQTSSVCIGTDWRGRSILEDQYVEISTDIFMPHIVFPKYTTPDIGEVRFIASNVLESNKTLSTDASKHYLIYDSENNGWWAYPRGQTVPCAPNEFVDACKVYGNNGRYGNDISFTLPSLTNFIKLNPCIQNLNANQFVNFQVGLPVHNHEIEQSLKDTSKTTVVLTALFHARGNPGYDGKNQAMHNYAGWSSKSVYPSNAMTIMDTTFNLSAGQTITQQTGEVTEAWPTYNRMPILVYIGEK